MIKQKLLKHVEKYNAIYIILLLFIYVNVLIISVELTTTVRGYINIFLVESLIFGFLFYILMLIGDSY